MKRHTLAESGVCMTLNTHQPCPTYRRIKPKSIRRAPRVTRAAFAFLLLRLPALLTSMLSKSPSAKEPTPKILVKGDIHARKLRDQELSPPLLGSPRLCTFLPRRYRGPNTPCSHTRRTCFWKSEDWRQYETFSIDFTWSMIAKKSGSK